MKKTHALLSRRTQNGLYDYSSPTAREDTVRSLVGESAIARQSMDTYWRKMKRYYDGMHDIAFYSGSFCEDMRLPWTPAQAPDGFVHVESQIDSKLPDFEFSPRGGVSSDTVRRREETVRRICETSFLAERNIRNERRLGIYGSAVWKIGWGRTDGGAADVIPEEALPEQIYPDPSAPNLDACEYVAYVYRLHRQRAYRLFGADIRARGEHFADYLQTPDGLTSADGEDRDTVTVTEFWFRQPTDGRSGSVSFAAGDIALCVLIGGKEVKYNPKYWRKTACTMYPFVLYGKVPNEGRLWGKSELEPLIGLIDAADRDLTFAQLNAAFSSNDVILAEENAFSDGEVPDNAPGAVWKLRPGMMGKVQRLGNLSSVQSALYSNYARWQSMMEQTTGNFEVNQGKEPTHVTTATGIALLNERAESRKALKACGRTEGFRRLYRLIDMTALEFYAPGRFVECADFGFAYEPEAYRDKKSGRFPMPDIKIHIGDGVTNSKAFTVSAVSSLVGTPITKDNYKLVEAYVEALGLPMRAELCAFIEQRFGEEKDETVSGTKGDSEHVENIKEAADENRRSVGGIEKTESNGNIGSIGNIGNVV